MNKNAELLKQLRDKVGVEQFIELSKIFNGNIISWNNYGCNGYISKEEQDEAIRKDFYHGMTWDELQNKYNLTMSALYKITQKR